MSDEHIPQALYFEMNKHGIPEHVFRISEGPEKANGFWATVIKRFPETDPENKWQYYDLLWLLKRETGAYMVLHERGTGDLHTAAVLHLNYPGLTFAELFFNMMRDMIVLPHQIHERILSTCLEHDPEGPGGHWKRAKRIIRDDLAKCQGDALMQVAAILGSNLSAERLKLRPKRAPQGERTET